MMLRILDLKPLLFQHALGIRPTAPGYATWDALPAHLGAASAGRLEWVLGRVPLPDLDLDDVRSVERAAGFEISLRSGRATASVPVGTTARIGT